MLTPTVHIFVCTNRRAPGDPLGCSCAAAGSEDVFAAFKAALAARGHLADVWVTRTGCMVHCQTGPTVVVYPRGDWYRQVTPEQVAAILDGYLRDRAAPDGSA